MVVTAEMTLHDLFKKGCVDFHANKYIRIDKWVSIWIMTFIRQLLSNPLFVTCVFTLNLNALVWSKTLSFIVHIRELLGRQLPLNGLEKKRFDLEKKIWCDWKKISQSLLKCHSISLELYFMFVLIHKSLSSWKGAIQLCFWICSSWWFIWRWLFSQWSKWWCENNWRIQSFIAGWKNTGDQW